MANIKSAIKADRQNKTKNEINTIQRSKTRTYAKKVLEVLNKEGATEARKALVEFESIIMKNVSKGIYKKNTASRKISRLCAQIRKVEESKK